MTSLISPAQAQALGIGLDLDTGTLQNVIDREEAELVRRFGSAAGARSETLDGDYTQVFVRRQISSVSAVTEATALGNTPNALTTTDYHVRVLTGVLTRLPECRLWGREVVVSYTPIDDTPLRTEVLIELVRIATEQAAWGDGSAVGGLSFTAKGGVTTGAEWQSQRDAQYIRMGGLVP